MVFNTPNAAIEAMNGFGFDWANIWVIKMTQKIIKLSYESLNDQRLTGLGCDLYIVSSNGIGFPAHASVVCSQSDVFQVLISFEY